MLRHPAPGGPHVAHRAPVTDITAGDNWFYNGVKGYDQATGVGVLDVAALADAIASECQ